MPSFCESIKEFDRKYTPSLNPSKLLNNKRVKVESREINRNLNEEIVKTKEPDLTAASLDAAVRTIAGSARSMGIETEGV